MYTIGNLQENLEGTYKYSASKQELKPISFVEKPKKSKRIVYSIRLGQINGRLLWVNHKDYAAHQAAVLAYSWDTFTQYCFSYGDDSYTFTIDNSSQPQQTVTINRC